MVQAEKYASDLKRNTELDELERELGLDLLDDNAHARSQSLGSPLEAGATVWAAASAPIESARPTRRGADDASVHGALGCIPTHWIAGLFTGSLPPSHAAHLVDWAVINRIKYAGERLTQRHIYTASNVGSVCIVTLQLGERVQPYLLLCRVLLIAVDDDDDDERRSLLLLLCISLQASSSQPLCWRCTRTRF